MHFAITADFLLSGCGLSRLRIVRARIFTLRRYFSWALKKNRYKKSQEFRIQQTIRKGRFTRGMEMYMHSVVCGEE
jgi:hypothetical protein